MPSQKEYFDGRYRLIRRLSEEGGTADVWLAEDMDTATKKINDDDEIVLIEGTGLQVAIKIYRPQNILDLNGELAFKREFMTVFNCHHENLLKPTGYSVRKDLPYLVLPFCPKGSAERLVGKLTSKDEIWKFLFHVASGLSYLHSCNPAIIHQDIKPANILIDNNDYYCITDFGISVKNKTYGLDNTDNNEDENEDNDENINNGTIIYMPPERFADHYEPIPASDIWSMGATVYELITGHVPFGKDGGEKQSHGAKIPEIKINIPKKLKKIIYACLNPNPDSRPTARQVANIARTKGRQWTRKSVAIMLFVSFLVCIAIAILTQPVPKPVSRFSKLCNSGDSIIKIEKDNALQSKPVEGKTTIKRLRQAASIYNDACTLKIEQKESTDLTRKKGIIKRIIKIEGIYPIIKQYCGICDTLNMTIEYDLPQQTRSYTLKRDNMSDLIKQNISNL